MVILGAGASYDSVPDSDIDDYARQQQPPLARGLFETRPTFNEAAAGWEVQELVSHLRGSLRNEKDIEQELEGIAKLAPKHSPYREQLMAMRYYLRDVIHDCCHWHAQADGITNYSGLVGRIDASRWAGRTVFVTFNYDTLLEQTLLKHKPYPVDEDWYLRPPFPVIKPHGSVTWGRATAWDAPRDSHTRALAQVAIQKARKQETPVPFTHTFVFSDNLTSLPPGLSYDGRRLAVPAIAVPTQAKDIATFEAPDEQMKLLEETIPRIRRMLIIGWRANEHHFLNLWTGRKREPFPGMIVSHREAGLTRSRMSDFGFRGAFEEFDEGFSMFIGSRALDDFLDLQG